jgi:crotonobetainyl-CoA:carnitine CoA-transferase CaiB-like acyl-CoA transferase
MSAAANTSPLSDIRVLDLTQVLSGPFCTQMLGDLGADIIKVEGPDGDISRTLLPYNIGDDSVYYHSINRNKRSLVVDLKKPEGLALIKRLALSCDVVIENFRPGVCDRLGFSADAMRIEKPSLIWCSISGFGQDGPYRDKAAYDMVVQALSGGMSLTGPKDGVSVRAGIPIGDLTSGLYASSAILAALHRREKTGRGDTIDISMLDCQVAMLCYQAAFNLNTGRVPGRQGREHDGNATYGTFAAKDGREIVVAAFTERMWTQLCQVLGSPELTAEARFLTNEQRLKNRAELTALLTERFRTRNADEWMQLLEAAGIPTGVVNTLDRVMIDPQVTHRGLVVEMKSEEGSARVIGDPIVFKEAPRREAIYPPPAGRDTAAILKDVLGLADGAIDGLVKSGTVRVRRKKSS